MILDFISSVASELTADRILYIVGLGISFLLSPQNRKALRMTLRRAKRRILVYVLRRRPRPIPCFFLAQIVAFLITDAIIGGEWPELAEWILGGYVWVLMLFAGFVGIRKAVRHMVRRKTSAAC